MPALYRMHPASLAAAYADVENHALNQDEVLVGTPGSITVRQNANGTRYYVRQYYDFDGRKRDLYLCQLEAPDCKATIDRWKARIEEAKQVQSSVRLLAREGYLTLSAMHLAALSPFSRHKIFEAGAVLVGSHAYGVIANRLGIRATSFLTEDIDLARPAPLALAQPLGMPFLDLLRESGIDFVGVPQFRPNEPPTKYKQRGRSRFTLDLLAPVPGEESQTVPVPELNAHASGLPYFRFLLGGTQMGAAICTHGVAAVRVPVPERFALHKLIVSQLRTGRSEKSRKDLQQAAVLIAALGELIPGALEEAYRKVPTSRRKDVVRSLGQMRVDLEAHPRSWEEIARSAKIM